MLRFESCKPGGKLHPIVLSWLILLGIGSWIQVLRAVLIRGVGRQCVGTITMSRFTNAASGAGPETYRRSASMTRASSMYALVVEVGYE